MPHNTRDLWNFWHQGISYSQISHTKISYKFGIIPNHISTAATTLLLQDLQNHLETLTFKIQIKKLYPKTWEETAENSHPKLREKRKHQNTTIAKVGKRKITDTSLELANKCNFHTNPFSNKLPPQKRIERYTFSPSLLPYLLLNLLTSTLYFPEGSYSCNKVNIFFLSHCSFERLE